MGHEAHWVAAHTFNTQASTSGRGSRACGSSTIAQALQPGAAAMYQTPLCVAMAMAQDRSSPFLWHGPASFRVLLPSAATGSCHAATSTSSGTRPEALQVVCSSLAEAAEATSLMLGHIALRGDGPPPLGQAWHIIISSSRSPEHAETHHHPSTGADSSSAHMLARRHGKGVACTITALMPVRVTATLQKPQHKAAQGAQCNVVTVTTTQSESFMFPSHHLPTYSSSLGPGIPT